MDAAMELKISSYDKPSFEQLYGLFREGRTISLGDGTELTFQGIEFKKAEGFPEVAAFLVSVSAHIPAALAADLIKDWIVTRFPKRGEIITIKEEEMTFSKKGKLKKFVRRQIEH